jgi:hypothetical protein
MHTATHHKADLTDFNGQAHCYRLDPPLKWRDWRNDLEHAAEFVVVSATVAMYSGPETYIFPSDENGKVINWGELDGSFKGALNHVTALRNAGYEVRDA